MHTDQSIFGNRWRPYSGAARIAYLVVAMLCTVNISLSQPSVRDQAPSEIAPAQTPFGVLEIKRPRFPDKDFDIRNFGAVEGGKVKCTEAIRKTIAAANEAGGGRIVIPQGVWLTGAVHLEDNTDLYLARGAELLFSQDIDDYLPAVFSRHEDTECYKFSAFVYANGKHNIGITGEGVLNGQGKPWWTWKMMSRESSARVVAMGDENVPVKERVFDGTNGNYLRPAFFQPMNCTNVLVEGVTFLYGAFWTITPTYCDSVVVRKVRIETEGKYGHTPNGDGVDPSSSRNVLIEYCEFATGDDCIAIKSGRDTDGLRVNKPTENVVVRHCEGLQGHGGIVIGSETSGGVRNVFAYDCRFNGTDRIVRVKTARGRGGVLENMWFEHLSADTIQQEALRINMLYTGKRLPPQPVGKTTPTIRNLHFSDISCMFGKTYAIELLGLPERPIEDITFDHITIRAAKGIHCVDVDSIAFKNVLVTPEQWPVVDITDGTSMTFDGIAVPQGANPFIRVNGPRARNISFVNTQMGSAFKVSEIGPDVTPGALRNPMNRNAQIVYCVSTCSRLALVVILAILEPHFLSAQPIEVVSPGKMPDPWSVRMADSFMSRHPDTIAYAGDAESGRWTYEQGVVLESLIQLARATGNERYWQYVRRNIDCYVRADGNIETYDFDTFNLDNIATGRALLALYATTHEVKYKWAADTLRKQLAQQPRTPEGGFWHKKIYPNQMWLDGLYMAEPFYAEYAQMFRETADFDDIARQFVLIETHTRDAKTGLLYHAWDESREQKWANPLTGTSPQFWSRAIGWYAWALVDVLDYFPKDHPKRMELVAILQRLSKALINFREPKTGLWYQVLDQGNRTGNYLEASGSCMFVYALAKGAEKGYLDKSYYTIAKESFKGVVDSLITVNDDGTINLNHACQGAGLGGVPYRDGSFEYYVNEKQRTNDFKAIGPFILAALELEKGASQ